MADYFSEMGWTPLGEGETLITSRLFRDYNMFEDLNALNGEKLPPPASKSVVEALPSESISKEGTQCPVCLKNHAKGENR
ncbi:hypothetical protein NQ318_013808 [Aromia moschata]|uniref:Uncharacterized protein n=1 Tax=Aromia moschata TaxID=1265417 RepID=A0AAV8ZAL9_9CUCU|nr:hypothetical protein NQ318_013808 [Aromia moschata]